MFEVQGPPCIKIELVLLGPLFRSVPAPVASHAPARRLLFRVLISSPSLVLSLLPSSPTLVSRSHLLDLFRLPQAPFATVIKVQFSSGYVLVSTIATAVRQQCGGATAAAAAATAAAP